MNNRQMHSQESGKTILENLKNLRFFEGDETEFWTCFLTNTAVLCKSPIVFFMSKEESEWAVRQEFYGIESLKTDKNLFVTSALNLVERAHQNGFAYERLESALPQISLPFALVSKIEASKTYEKSVVFIVVDRGNAQQFNDMVVRTQLISDIPLDYYTRKQKSHTDAGNESNQLLVNALEVVNTIMHKERYLLSCMTLVNEIAHRFNCSQVSIGWQKSHYIRTVAISHLENFKKHSEAISALEGVFEEAYEQDEIVVYPKMNDKSIINRTHQKYCKKQNLNQVVTIPVHINDKIIAVMTCEKQDSALTVFEIDAVTLIVNHVAPWLNVLHYNDRWFGSLIAIRLKEMLVSWLGVEHSILKATAIIISAALLYSFVGEWDYKVEGSVTLKTDSVSYISAPYDGVIYDVKVHEGDEVKKDDLLLKLDTKELLLKEAQGAADIVRYISEAEKNRANKALADMKIALSKVEESQAGLDKVRYYIEQASIKAPFDSIVIEGEKQKLIGSPVTKGDILLKIAKVDEMYINIKISERDISEIAKGAKGQLILLSRPANTFNVTVDKMIPMAEVDQREGNVFVVKATIDDNPQAWWRPGMSGIVKIYVGKRKCIWILTHRLTEFIRMFYWKYMG